jgi:hypothetical protein
VPTGVISGAVRAVKARAPTMGRGLWSGRLTPRPNVMPTGIGLLSSAPRKQTLLEEVLVQPGWLLQKWKVYQFLVIPLVMDSLSPAVKQLMQDRDLELDNCPDEAALKAATS